LLRLQQRFNDKIKIMPGGGIRACNLPEIVSRTLCNEFHSAAITEGKDIADGDEIKELKRILASSR
jgi:copper homeostasis protein CutC